MSITQPGNVIELVEHAPALIRPLHPVVGRELASSGIAQATPDPYLPGQWRLKAASKVGAVMIGVPGGESVTVRIVPKVPIARLFFLLGYSLDPKGWRNEQVTLAEHADLLPAFAHVFDQHAERALRQGLLQGYRVSEESALVVRGRIREAEQLRRHFGGPLPVEIAYDEFSTDIAENRLLRAATERLLRLPDVPTAVRRRLLHHRARLADVSMLIRGRPLPEWRPTRLNARYHHALRLARAVLRNSSAEHRPGGLRVDGFLLDMNRLFEDFVCLALRDACAATGSTCRRQDVHPLDEAQEIRMRPDLVLYDAGSRLQAVVDAKYKAEKRDGYPEADLYQMLAYCTALGLSEGHLVYARGNAPHATHRIRHAGVTLHQHALDLDQPPAGLLAEIRALADRLTAASPAPTASA